MPNVYANNREISCKAAAGKTICAFPDVCFTPPQTPATPPGVPVPYPNTGMASDTTKGSKSVKIEKKEVGLKDQSYFKKSMGDEAGSAPKKGIITSKNRGKVYFNSWSMDVKIEGKNVTRHLDLTTNNHASKPGDTPTWPYTDRMDMAKGLKSCDDEIKAMEDCEKDEDGHVKCPKRGNKSHEQYAKAVEKDPCQRAARCILSPKSPSKCCKPGQTPHHLVPGAGFLGKTRKLPGCGGYDYDAAPCICVEGYNQTQGTHGLVHDVQKQSLLDRFPDLGPKEISEQRWTFNDAVNDAGKAANETFPQCREKCIKAQLRRGHRDMGIDGSTKLKPIATGPKDVSKFRKAFQKLQATFSATTGIG